MRKVLKIVLSLVLVLVFALSFLGFTTVLVKSIALDKKDLTMYKDTVYTLKVTVKPSNATNKKMNFSSSDKQIAAVDSQGKIQAYKEGKAVITVTSAANKKAVAKCNVTVTKVPPVKLSIVSVGFQAVPPKKDGWAQKAIEEYCNADMDITWIPAAVYEDKQAALIAAGDIPDVMVTRDQKRSYMVSSILAGAFWDLTPYYKNYDRFALTDPVTVKNLLVKGKLYGIPRGRVVSRDGVFYRGDWLDALVMKEPTTIDELYNVMKAWTLNDPDKNGKNDTYGFALQSNLYGFLYIKTVFGAGPAYTYYDGDMIPDFMTKEYLDALKWCRKLYTEKLMTQDWVLTTTAQQLELLNTKGTLGSMISTIDAAVAQEKTLQKVIPNARLDVLNQIRGPKGLKVNSQAGHAGMLLISRQRVKDEARLKEILGVLNKIDSAAMQNLIRYGIEGTHYKVVNEKAEVIDALTVTNEASDFGQITATLASIPAYMKPVTYSELQKKIERLQLVEAPKIVEINPAEPFISKTASEKGATLGTLVNDAIKKYIMNALDDEGWEKVLAQWKKDGGDKICRELLVEYVKVNND